MRTTSTGSTALLSLEKKTKAFAFLLYTETVWAGTWAGSWATAWAPPAGFGLVSPFSFYVSSFEFTFVFPNFADLNFY
jgi:hypothetical protein